MDDILNKIKRGAIQVKDGAEKFTKETVEKTKKVIDRTKYNYTISEIESRIKDILAELGKKLYDEYENGVEFDEEIKDSCQKIDELKNEIDETMAENLLNLKKEQITRYRKTEGAKQDEPKQTLTKIYYD